MKRFSIFAFVSVVLLTSASFAASVTRYTKTGAQASTSDTLYGAVTTGSPAAADEDVVVLSADARRGTAEITSPGKLTIKSADGNVHTLSIPSGQTGRFYNKSGGTLTLENVTLDGGNLTGGEGTAIYGNVLLTSGTNTIQNCYAPIGTSGNNGTIRGNLTITGGTNLFESNTTRQGPVAKGTIKISGGTNTFRNGTATYGGVFYSNGSLSNGLTTSGGTNLFEGNKSMNGGVLEGYITITGGTSIFRDNSASNLAGALYLYDAAFSGDETVVIFEGNTDKDGPSDIRQHGDGSKTVSVSGNGTYYFGSGIQMENWKSTGGNITFGEGSVTKFTGSFKLSNTNLTLNFGTDEAGKKTSFAVPASSAITDGGGNTLKFVLDETFLDGATLISGDTSGLKTAPMVEIAGNPDSVAYVSASGTGGLKVSLIDSPTANLSHFSTSGAAMTMKESRNTLYSASQSIASGDSFILSGDVTRGSSVLTVPANATLTIRSNATGLARGITPGAGETGRMLEAGSGSSVTLQDVTVSGFSNETVNGGAINAASVILTGTTTFSGNTALNGGAINGNVAINGADSRIVLSGNTAKGASDAHAEGGAVNGTLTINAGTNRFESNVAIAAGKGNYGGGVAKELVVKGGTNSFTGNSAYLGGVAKKLTISGGTNSFSGNKATWGGVAYGALNISGGTNSFDGNQVNGGVGGIIQGNVTISGGTTYFTNNQATNWGGALFLDASATFSGDATYVSFSGNTQKINDSANKTPNDVYAFRSTGVVNFSGSGTYLFGGGISVPKINVDGGSILFRGGSITNGAYFESASNTQYTTLTQTAGTLTLTGTAQMRANATISGGEFRFRSIAGEADGFGTLTAESITVSGTGKMTAGINAFSFISGQTYTLAKGKDLTGSVSSTNSNLFTVSLSGSDTILTVKNSGLPTTGSYGQIQLSSFSDGSPITDLNFYVDSSNVASFADWLKSETGLETIVAGDSVSVKFDDAFTPDLVKARLYWDFSPSGALGTTLQGVSANQLSNLVPEPATWILFLLGMIGLFIRKMA